MGPRREEAPEARPTELRWWTWSRHEKPREERVLALFKEHGGKIERGVREAQPRTIRKVAKVLAVKPKDLMKE